MKITLLITSLLVSSTTQLIPRRCTGVFFNDKYYNTEVVKEGVNKMHNIAINRNDNTLYFTFEDVITPTTSLGFLSLSTRTSGLIESVRNASGIAIDHVRNKVFVGSSEGLYLITNMNTPIKLPVNDPIKSLFHKDNLLYFINAKGEAKIFEDGYVSPVKELSKIEVDELVLDDDNNIFFRYNDVLSRVKLGTRIINTHDRLKVNYITTDPYYKPYILARDGVYAYNKYKFALDRVSLLENLRVITFNKLYEPIYGIIGMIIKLNYNPITCGDY